MDPWIGVTVRRFVFVFLCSSCADQQVVSAVGYCFQGFTVMGGVKHWMGLSVFISIMRSSDLHCHVAPLNEKDGMTVWMRAKI